MQVCARMPEGERCSALGVGGTQGVCATNRLSLHSAMIIWRILIRFVFLLVQITVPNGRCHPSLL